MENISRICQSLAFEIENKTYTPSSYTRFAVVDPKIREIYAPAFRDRLVQCWLVYHLTPATERILIDDTYANRKGKGSLAAVQKAQTFMRKPSQSHYLQLDIQNFFNSIKLSKLMTLCDAIIARYFNGHPLKEILFYVLKQSIYHSATSNTVTISGDKHLLSLIPKHKTLCAVPRGVGLPLGSAASQLFANIYLNPLDHFIKHHLHIRGYVRYMDDLLITGNSPSQLSQWRKHISHFIEQELSLCLHPKKQVIQTCYQGADYLGYKVYPHYLHLRKRNINKLLTWLSFFNAKLSGKTITPALHIQHKPEWNHYFSASQIFPLRPDYALLQHMQSVINSYFGLMKHAQHYRLRKMIYHKHFHLLKTFYLPSDAHYSAIHIKKHILANWINEQKNMFSKKI